MPAPQDLEAAQTIPYTYDDAQAPARALLLAGDAQAPRAEFRGLRAHGRVALSQGRVAANGTRQVYAELRMTADEATSPEVEQRPVAMALVLDVSGSMSGEKIEQARQSVLSMIEQMRDTDRIALVTYSDSARVVQPLAMVRDVRAQLRAVVPTIQIEGGTNIPSGLGLGAQALAEAPDTLVRRVVLMSDGRDGSGRPLDVIAQDVRQRAEGGVTLSSLGVGADYDESYMSRLADAGRGNYEFLRDGAQLRAFLGRELQQATRTTVERAVAEVTLPAGWHLTRAYGAEAQVTGSTVRLPIGALFAGDERRLVLDLTLVNLPGYEAQGQTTKGFNDGNLTRISLDAAWAGGRVTDFAFMARTVPVGLYVHDVHSDGWGGVEGSTGILGLAGVFEYTVHDYDRDQSRPLDIVSIVSPIGVYGEYTYRRGWARIRPELMILGDFAGVTAYGLESWRGRNGVAVEIPSVLVEKGYYHGVGATASGSLALGVGPLEVGGRARVDTIRLLDGFDEKPRAPQLSIADRRVVGGVWAGVTIPSTGWGIRLDAETRQREGNVGDGRASQSEVAFMGMTSWRF